MTLLEGLLVALGAGLGAVLRFVVAGRADRPAFPVGTWAVNVAGSLVLGVLVGAEVGGAATALLGTGFCGGLTTYSSFVVQTHDRGWTRGASYAAATLLVALAACSLGWLLGHAVSRGLA